MKKRTWEIAIFCIIVIIALFKWYNDYDRDGKINSLPGYTVGEIIDYYVVGEASPYLKYTYQVEGKNYENLVIPSHLFKGCEKTKDCIGRKIRVKYYQNDPSQSRILLGEEER